MVSYLYLTEGNCRRDVELEKFPREEERAQQAQKSTQVQILEVCNDSANRGLTVSGGRNTIPTYLSLLCLLHYKQLSWSRVSATQGYMGDPASKKERTRRKRKKR